MFGSVNFKIIFMYYYIINFFFKNVIVLRESFLVFKMCKEIKRLKLVKY